MGITENQFDVGQQVRIAADQLATEPPDVSLPVVALRLVPGWLRLTNLVGTRQ